MQLRSEVRCGRSPLGGSKFVLEEGVEGEREEEARREKREKKREKSRGRQMSRLMVASASGVGGKGERCWWQVRAECLVKRA